MRPRYPTLIDPRTLQGDFTDPPRNQGQTATYSYAIDGFLIVERRHDEFDGATTYHAYGFAEGASFDPQNGNPQLGVDLAPVLLVRSWEEVPAEDLRDFLARIAEGGYYPEDFDGLLDRIERGPTFWTARCLEDGSEIDLEQPLDLSDTQENGESWLSEGEWPPLSRIEGQVYPQGLDSGDYDEGEISIRTDPPEEPSCPANGDGKHDWTAEHEGRCTENPGVWFLGGTTFHFAAHCRRCGMSREETYHGTRRNPGERDRVEYGDTDPEWVENHYGESG